MAITLERLKELLHYDPSTGKFTWRVQRTGRGGSKPGDIAGAVRARKRAAEDFIKSSKEAD